MPSPQPFKLPRRFWLGLLSTLVIIACTVAWYQANPVTPAVLRPFNQPFINLAGGNAASRDQLLHEKAELLDPTPLFFPTEWNYGQRPLQESSFVQPIHVFGIIEPKPIVDELGKSLPEVETMPIPERLSDLLVQGNEAPFAGFGEVRRAGPTLPVRSGYIEVTEHGSSESIIKQQLSGINPPRTDFAPVEFLVIVSTAGLITDPIVTSGSGWEDVDNFFRTYLVGSYHLGARLRPGSYRVLIGA